MVFWVESSHASGKITNGDKAIIIGFTCTKILSVHSNDFINPAQLCVVKLIICGEETKSGKSYKGQK